MDEFLSFVGHGLLPLPWWGYVVVALALTHVTIAAVTIYLHRHSGAPGAGPAPGASPISSASGCG